MTFEQAKDQVAVKYGYKSWEKLGFYELDESTQNWLTKEAAELYAKSKWDEACDAMEDAIVDNLGEEVRAARNTKRPEFKP